MRTPAGPRRLREHGAAVSVRCAALLDGPAQDVDVLAVFPAAVYLATRQPQADVFAVLAADAVVHPAAFVLAVRSTREPFFELDRTSVGAVGEGRLRVGDHQLKVGRWYDPIPHLRVPDPERLAIGARALRAACDHSLAVVRPDGHGQVEPQGPHTRLRIRLKGLADALADDDVRGAVAAVDALLGAGSGLTPTGDDMLAGLLATLHHVRPALHGVADRCAEVAVREHVRTCSRSRTTLLSATLLEHALDGAVAAPVARLLRTLTTGPRPVAPGTTDPVQLAIDEVIGIGATSGQDLLDGVAIAFELAAAEGMVTTGARSTVDDEGAS